MIHKHHEGAEKAFDLRVSSVLETDQRAAARGTGAFCTGEKRSIASLLMCLSEQAATSAKTGQDLEKHTCNS